MLLIAIPAMADARMGMMGVTDVNNDIKNTVANMQKLIKSTTELFHILKTVFNTNIDTATRIPAKA